MHSPNDGVVSHGRHDAVTKLPLEDVDDEVCGLDDLHAPDELERDGLRGAGQLDGSLVALLVVDLALRRLELGDDGPGLVFGQAGDVAVVRLDPALDEAVRHGC